MAAQCAAAAPLDADPGPGLGAVAGLVLLLFAATGFGGLPGVLVPMWLVIAGGMLAANAVLLLLVVRPWRLPVDNTEPAVAVAH